MVRKTRRRKTAIGENHLWELATGITFRVEGVENFRGDKEAMREAWADPAVRAAVRDKLARKFPDGDGPEIPWAEKQFGKLD